MDGVAAAGEVLALGVEGIGVGPQCRDGLVLDEIIEVIQKTLSAPQAVPEEGDEVVGAV